MMAQRRQLDMFTKGRIVEMLESSRSQTKVSRNMNVDQSVISILWQMFQRMRDVTRQTVSGLNQELQPLAKTDICNGMDRHHDGRRHRPPFFDTGSVTAQRYTNEVPEPYVRLLRGAVGPDFIFMNDNASCHQAVLIDDFLETENTQRMSWPANSSDLNPIKHVWDMLGRQIVDLSHPPNSVTELKIALQKAWKPFEPTTHSSSHSKCALWAGGIIGPYFFKNDEGHDVTVNGDRYGAMITNFFIPELNNHDVQELWFQQDGATCHTARATIDLLKDTFGDRLISRFGPVNWPPRSCNLTHG
ncbi:transposable element Tc3 transposase [Trichonephila clavipes]|nr:transposable element Tc3 transposase [Trichonephila clavipes]